MKISNALDDIRNQNLVLPEFQREYVWTLDQAKQLISSLMQGWPVGGLLIWKTDAPPELKNVKALPDKIGTVQVLLDGQQRLTTLHMLLTGEIPRYYKPEEIENDPRQLSVNLETGELQYFQSKMKLDPRWRRIVECFGPDVNLFAIAHQIAQTDQERFEAANRLNNVLSRVRAIGDIDLTVQTVPAAAPLNDAITIFDRINSQGTKLTDAELALTHVTAKWPEARRVLKAKIEELRKQSFYFDLTFMTRALTVAVTGRALFREIHDVPRDQLVEGWKRLSKTLDYLVNLLPSRAFINSTSDLNTSNALIPLIAYLRSEGKFSKDAEIKHAVNWLHTALIWTRYTSQTDQRLEADIGVVAKETAPWDHLRDAIIEQRGRIRVEPADLAGRGVQNPLYRAAFSLAKAHSATDWFNGVPLCQPHGQTFKLHSHHIFPQALLYRSGYSPKSLADQQLVNEIANRAFLTAESNISTSDTAPEIYLPQVEQRFPGALTAQFVPMDPQLWRVDRFEDFLAARRKLIAAKLNEFLSALITKPDPPRNRPIAELIALGEGYTLEFKSSWQWDVRQGVINKNLRYSCLKTIAAFLNSEGGTLVIGVEDDGNVLGLDHDIAAARDSTDWLQQQIVSTIADQIGVGATSYIRIRFEAVGGPTVCIVENDPASQPAFLKTEKGQEFFLRVGNTTRSLNVEECNAYIQQHRS